ncbi:MAG: hypothetical protein ETSY2_31655 [Candidatus Entotheonella gemina]|uniref:Uncharacterized protein n=1 Tax=Candidatus Entotheonella gemina TaxID=1429439 RepID=W4M1C9_9BACT|nr:MAG: hypothetical protein ETSY2_31655 [Candidatus Entotheonella gemina]
MMKSFHNEAGLTLIETLIALTIFSVGMLGLSSLTTIVLYGNTLSQKITMATILAHEKIEAVHDISYDQLESQEEKVTTDNRSRYIRETEVRDNTPRQGMKTVSISVYWTQTNSTKNHVSLKTIVIDDR